MISFEINGKEVAPNNFGGPNGSISPMDEGVIAVTEKGSEGNFAKASGCCYFQEAEEVLQLPSCPGFFG